MATAEKAVGGGGEAPRVAFPFQGAWQGTVGPSQLGLGLLVRHLAARSAKVTQEMTVILQKKNRRLRNCFSS